jgi:hypothetical protein
LSGRPDIARLQTIEGTIASINLGVGLRYPSIGINGLVIRVAPLWYLLENDFELVVGEQVRIVAAVSTQAGDPYLHAVSVIRLRNSVALTLRSDAGFPLWSQGGRNNQPIAPPRRGTCGLPATTVTVSGTVEDVSLGLGIQHPTLTLLTQSGSLLTFKLGPERVLLASDVELIPGAQLTIEYVSSACADELIVLRIVDTDGDVLILRDSNAVPVW